MTVKVSALGEDTSPTTDDYVLAVDNATGSSKKVQMGNIPASTAATLAAGADRTKLDGIATGATANSSDAILEARANHTGTQSADTLTDGTTNKAYTATEKTKLAGITGSNTGDQDLSGKQDTLVSGTNIKTVNSTSLLGSGDIVVAGSASPRTTRFVVAPYGDTRPADYTCANNTANNVEINAAIVAANALPNGGIVDLLDGTFTLGASVVPLNNVWLRGQGMFQTKITTVSGSTFGILDNYTTYNATTPYTNGTLSDMELDGSNMLNSNGKKAFNASSLKYCKLMRLYAHDTTATGLGADDYTGVTITECIVQNCGYSLTRAITALVYSTNTFTVTTGTAHSRSVGDSIVVSGMVPLTYNGVFKVTSVIDTLNFTIATSNNSGNLQLSIDSGAVTTYGQISASILGCNGIGIASGSNTSEYLIVTNNICIGNQNNNFLIEADNVGTGGNASYIFSNNISISAGNVGYRNTGTPNVQFNNNYDYGSLISCFAGVTNISKTLNASSWAASVATYTTVAVHGFTVGQYVTVSGVTPAGYNGYFYIASVPTTTTFTVAMTVDPVGAGSVFGSSQIIGHDVDGTQINHNTFVSPVLYGIQIYAHSDGVSARGNTIKNGSFYGMYVGSGNGTIAGNRIYGNGYDGIEIITGGNYQPLDSLDVSGNIIYNNGTRDALHDGINVNPNASTPITNLTLSNNHCTDNQDTKTQRYGIYLRSGSNLTNCSVVGGALAGNLTNAILIQNTETSISVLGVSGTSNVGFSIGTLTNLAITTPSASNLTSLTVTQSDTTNNPALATLTNSGTGFGINLIQNGILATNKMALYIQSNAVNTNSSLAWIRSTNASTTQAVFRIDQAGTGLALDVRTGKNALGGATSIGKTTSPVTILDVAGPIATAYAAKTTTYTITATDSVIDCTSGTFTVTLPTAVGCTGRQYVVKNSGAGVITVATTSSQTIDDVTTFSIATQYQAAVVISDGANWILEDSVIAERAAAATLTNKRVTKRTPTVTQSATPTINTDVTDVAHITGLAQDITSMTTNLTGTPVEGDTLRIDITDNGTARAIAWGAKFEASTVALPTTTVISARLDVGFVWNTVTSKWRCVAVA